MQWWHKNGFFSKLFMIFITILLTVYSCAPLHNIPVETQYNIVDSIQVHQVDSVVYIPKEVIKDVVPVYDTLKMETSFSRAEAYVDTLTHTLKGKLENKKGVEYKYIYKDRVEYRDSTVIKEVPVPVEVEKEIKIYPKYEPLLWFFTVLAVIFLSLKLYKIYLKFRV